MLVHKFVSQLCRRPDMGGVKRGCFSKVKQ